MFILLLFWKRWSKEKWETPARFDSDKNIFFSMYSSSLCCILLLCFDVTDDHVLCCMAKKQEFTTPTPSFAKIMAAYPEILPKRCHSPLLRCNCCVLFLPYLSLFDSSFGLVLQSWGPSVSPRHVWELKEKRFVLYRWIAVEYFGIIDHSHLPSQKETAPSGGTCWGGKSQPLAVLKPIMAPWVSKSSNK